MGKGGGGKYCFGAGLHKRWGRSGGRETVKKNGGGGWGDQKRVSEVREKFLGAVPPGKT